MVGDVVVVAGDKNMSGTRSKDPVTFKTGIRGRDWRPHRGGEVEIREVLSKTRLLVDRGRLARAVVRTSVGTERRKYETSLY